MVLHKTKNKIKVDKISKKIALILGETKWNDQQRQKQRKELPKSKKTSLIKKKKLRRQRWHTIIIIIIIVNIPLSTQAEY